MTGRSSSYSLFQIAGAVSALLIAYLLAFGPFCWATHRFDVGHKCFRLAYWPIGMLAEEGPFPIRRLVFKVASIGIDEREAIRIPTRPFSDESIHKYPRPMTWWLFAGPMPGSPEGPRISIAPDELIHSKLSERTSTSNSLSSSGK